MVHQLLVDQLAGWFYEIAICYFAKRGLFYEIAYYSFAQRPEINENRPRHQQIEQLAQRVARIILDQLHEGLILDMQPDDEEDLLAELARCMTLMSKYLAEEQYEKCELLKKKIKTIEQKLKNL